MSNPIIDGKTLCEWWTEAYRKQGVDAEGWDGASKEGRAAWDELAGRLSGSPHSGPAVFGFFPSQPVGSA